MKPTFFYALLFLFAACNPVENTSILWVNSYQVDCTGAGKMKCMLIQKGEAINEDGWQNFYSRIEGFEYEPGYLYKLKVKEERLENVPADASSIKYMLVEVMEKKEDRRLKVNGSWNAVKINGSIIKLPRTRGAGVIPHLDIDIKTMQISGIDNCNNFSGMILTLDDQNIKLGPLAATKKMCPDLTIANAFNDALNGVSKYQLDGNVLKFMDSEGVELLEFTKGTEAKVLINDIWVAEMVDGETVAEKPNAPMLEINSSKMEVIGFDGCNNLNGKIITLTNYELTFGPLAATSKMCTDMTIPGKFNKALSLVRSYRIANLKLSLVDEQGNVLVVLNKSD